MSGMNQKSATNNSPIDFSSLQGNTPEKISASKDFCLLQTHPCATEGCRLSFVTYCKFLPAFGATPGQNIATVFRCHPLAKTVGVLSLSFMRLKCSLHCKLLKVLLLMLLCGWLPCSNEKEGCRLMAILLHYHFIMSGHKVNQRPKEIQ